MEYMCFSAEFQDGRKNCGKMICGKSGRIFIKITLFRTVIEINVFLHFTIEILEGGKMICGKKCI